MYNTKKQDLIYVTREIPLEMFKTLKSVNKKTGLTLEQELLDFCKSPRSITELKALLGLSTKKKVQERFTKPLLRQGKLKFVYPESPTSILQRYLNASVEITSDMQETLLQLSKTEKHLELEQKTLNFCKVPRTVGEIKDYIGLASYDIVRKRAIQPLIDQGKIKLLYPHNPLYKKQKFVISESVVGFPPFTEKEIIAFCETPRSKEEIKNHFGIKQDLLYKVLNPIIGVGKLSYTKCVKIGKSIIHPKLVKNDNPQAVTIVRPKPTDEEIIEFCKTPRHSFELSQEFVFSSHTCKKIVDRLIRVGKLIYTEDTKSYRRQLLKNDPLLVEKLNDGKLKDEEVIAYCKVPRLIQEIQTNFGITNYQCKKCLDKLIAEGKLVFTEQARSWYRKIKAKDISKDTVTEEKIVTDDAIIAFCNVPRYAYEIKKEFHLDNLFFNKIIEKLMVDGRLRNTEKDKGYYRKFLKNG